MRSIERSTAFKRDYKREMKGRHGRDLPRLLARILERLAHDEPLDRALRDHPLSGNWSDFRECHLKPDLLLIYAKPDEDTLELARLGSHSELF